MTNQQEKSVKAVKAPSNSTWASVLTRTRHYPWIVLVMLVVLRALSLQYPALLDPTESRYAVVAQKMFMSGDWLTPKIMMNGESISYLGKPPLHFWLTALSFSAFGMDEWVARLPSLLSMLLIMASTYFFSSKVLRLNFPLGAPLIVGTSGLVFVLAGGVTIDLTLAATIAMALTCFAIGSESQSPKECKLWGLGFFIACALTFMTKGPIGLVLVGLPILGCALVERKLADLKRLPWILGIVIFGLITLPWFLLCENKNPGFLFYFFINENFLRFVSRSYGDRYGSGHVHPYGSAWWMWAVGFLPWILLVPWLLKKYGIRSFLKLTDSKSRWMLFAMIWAIAPALFFSIARQIHIGYLAPAMPGLAVLTSALLERELPVMGPRKISGLLISLLIGILGIWAAPFIFKLHANFLIVAIIAIPVAILSASIPARLLSLDVRAFTTVMSALLGLMWLSILSVGSDYIGKQLSTDFMLRCAVRSNVDSKPTVGIFSDTAYSAEFNSANWQSALGRPVVLSYFDDVAAKQQSASSLPADLLVRTRKINELLPEIKSTYGVALSEGRWTWLRRSTLPVDVSLCN